MEASGTPIFDELLKELGDPFAHDEELQFARELWDESKGLLDKVATTDTVQEIDEEARRGHKLV